MKLNTSVSTGLCYVTSHSFITGQYMDMLEINLDFSNEFQFLVLLDIFSNEFQFPILYDLDITK